MAPNILLKFGKLFHLAKYLGHTQKFQCMEFCRGLVAPIKFLDSLSILEIEIECRNLVRW